MHSSSINIDLKGNLQFNVATKLNHEFIISSWNRGLKYYGKEDGIWEEDEIDTGFSFISNEKIEVQDESVSLFLEQVPQDIVKLIKPYQYRQFTMLQIMAQFPQTIDIFKRSATLFWMVVAEGADRQWSHAEIVDVLHKKRTSIIELLIGNPCIKGVKFIDKLILQSAEIKEFDLIKKSLLDDLLIESFAHQKEVLIQTVSVVYKKRSFLNAKTLLNEVDLKKTAFSQGLKFRRYDNIIKDINRMANLLGQPLPVKYSKNYTSEAALNRLHDNWVTRFNQSQAYQDMLEEREQQSAESKAHYDELKKAVYPLCPLGDFENFIQIKDYPGLAKEGADMNHCVASYFTSAVNDGNYFYKLLSPERATVQIKQQFGKTSVIQFKLKSNKKPNRESYDYLYQLLSGK